MDDDPSKRIDICWQSRLAPVQDEIIHRAVETALSICGCASAELSVAAVDDAEMAALHERHRGQPGPTDVLSFDLRRVPTDKVVSPEGEVVVSAETAARMAESLGTTLEAELLLYVVHGVLHLMGHDDTDDESATIMRALEDEVMQALGYGVVVREAAR